MNYTHLTREERYQIYALKKAGHTQSEIAKVLGHSPSTISRELRRNRGQRVYADKKVGGTLWRNLRCQKLRRKRYGKNDWEADTIIGKGHKQALVSLVERKSGFTLIEKVERKTAQAVSEAMIKLLRPYRKRGHTITSDNGREFAGHESISKQLKTDFYFAHPYASWARGTNENTNGLTRQYFPKNRDFTTITQQEIDMTMHRLNNRPRKRLEYQTPAQRYSFNQALHFKFEAAYPV
ncbi:MAG: hypothetical protein Fur0040_10740 [Sideroxydans sp.]